MITETLSLQFYFDHHVGDEELTQIASHVNKSLQEQRIKAGTVTFEGKHSIDPQLKKVAKWARHWLRIARSNRKRCEDGKLIPQKR